MHLTSTSVFWSHLIVLCEKQSEIKVENTERFENLSQIWSPMQELQSWSELLSPLLTVIKEGSEKKPALLLLLIFDFKNHKNLTFHWTKTIENGGKYHYEIKVFLKYTLDTIIGTPRNSYE